MAGIEREDLGSWISGPRSALDAAGIDLGYRGERLGLPPSGPGSVAGFGRRIGALFVDWFAAIAVTGLVVVVLLDGRYAYGSGPYQLMVLAVFGVAKVLGTWLGGQSFGQRLLGVRVTGLDRPLGLGRSTVRTLLVLAVIPAVVYDRDGRGMHDRAVNSVVLTVR